MASSTVSHVANAVTSEACLRIKRRTPQLSSPLHPARATPGYTGNRLTVTAAFPSIFEAPQKPSALAASVSPRLDSNALAQSAEQRGVEHSKPTGAGHVRGEDPGSFAASATSLLPQWIVGRSNVARTNSDSRPSDSKATENDERRFDATTRGSVSEPADHAHCPACSGRMDASHLVASVSSPPGLTGLRHVSPRDIPVLSLGFVACSISAALSGMIFAAIPALLAVRRAALAVERLATTAREELPGTMAAVRLSGMEISDLTMELSDLSHEISQGVRTSSGSSRLPSSAKPKEQHTAESLKDATVIPIHVVSPLFSSAAGAVGDASLSVLYLVQHSNPPPPPESLKDATVIPIRVVSPLFSSAAGAVGAAASTVGSTVSHVGGAVGSTVSHMGGAVGAAATHVGGAVGSTVSHVGGAASHIPSVVFNLVDFLPWGHRRGSEGGEGEGRRSEGGEDGGRGSEGGGEEAFSAAASAPGTPPTDISNGSQFADPLTKADPAPAAAASATSTSAATAATASASAATSSAAAARVAAAAAQPITASGESANREAGTTRSAGEPPSHAVTGKSSQASGGTAHTVTPDSPHGSPTAAATGEASEGFFEWSSAPSLVGWLQQRKDKEKQQGSSVKGSSLGHD